MQHRPKDIRPILMFQYKTDYNNDVYGVYRILGVIGKVLAVVEVVLAAAAAGTAVSAATSRLSRLAAGVMLAVQGITLFYTTRLLPPSRLVQVLSGKDVGLTMMSSLMQHFYQPMLKKAREDKLPIIDMPNTFDPKAPHYISGIEPNEAGGGIIAQLIAHVVQSDDTKGESRLYAYRGNTHHNSFNRSGSWQVTDSYS